MENDSIQYKTLLGCPVEVIYHDMANLYSEIFEDADKKFFKERIDEHAKLYSVLAYRNKKLIGFKIGYPYNENTFYSWIGGVLPKFRQQGVAKHMAYLQEQWAVQNKFEILKTKSMNRFKEMIILNFKNGFEITKVYTNSRGQTKIVFEKHLI